MRMLRIVLLCLAIGASLYSSGQFKKQFHVEDQKTISKVDLNLKFNAGNCILKSTQQPGIFNLYSKQENENYSHKYTKTITGNTAFIKLELEDSQPQGLSKSISNSLFGSSSNNSEKYWKVFLNEEKPYNLHLDYGIGQASLDLSELSVERITMHTGSADVHIGYFSDGYNKIEMDTFYIKVDLGNVQVAKLNHARSSYVVADVGFGNLFLDLGDAPTRSSTIKGHVGAGSLHILLPKKDIPIKLHINDSWLCSVKLPSDFKKVGNGTYVNSAFQTSKKNVMEFDLDVAMGSLIFEQK